LRDGKTMDVTVKIGRLPEDEDTERADEGDDSLQAPQPEKEDLLGLTIAPLTEELRSKYGISDKIDGVIITDVKPDSPAAKKNVKPGDVIVEVTQEEVHQPQDVVTRLEAVKRSGRGRVLLLLSDAKGELRFVAVPTG
jgi:serine protease Do